MNRSRFLISAVAAVVFLPAAGWCADPPAPPPVRAFQTLQQALANAPAPSDGLYLTVAADRVTLPAGAQPPGKDDAPDAVAADYGRLVDAFDTVTAIAPPTMVVLNTNPGTPNPYDGMPPSDIIKIFLSGLSDSQWKLLTGKTGIGLADLTGDDQRKEFLGLFPSGRLNIQRQYAPGSHEPYAPVPAIARDEIARSRLRMGQFVQVGIPVVGKNNQEWMDAPPNFGNGGYEAFYGNNGESEQEMLCGVRVRAAVPNAPKPFDLDLDAPALRRDVTLDGVKTVADLVAAVAKTTGFELYADRRYEERTVTLVGPPRARARDLLSALALCVAGAYRKVGPAYVLTDDVQGAGARRLILKRFAAEAEMARRGAISDMGDKLITTHAVGALPSLDEASDFNDAEKAELAKNANRDPWSASELQVPMTSLSAAQRTVAQDFASQWNSSTAQNPVNQQAVSTDGKILLMMQPALLLVVPSLPDPVSLTQYCNCWSLYQPSDKLRQQYWNARNAAAEPASPAPKSPATLEKAAPPPPPALGPLLGAYRRRTIYAAPRTAAGVDSLMDSMKAAGLNALYLDVFSNGRAHVPGSDLPHDDFKPDQADILTEALKRGKEDGIAVLPVLDLLRWGSDAPEDVQDLSILGETSSASELWQSRFEAVEYQGKSLEDAQKIVSPEFVFACLQAPRVRDGLAAFVQSLASRPGVAGIVFRQTSVPGYDRAPGSRMGTSEPGLGYTLPLRLAFLRREHVDPIDLEPEGNFGNVTADLSLPEFDDYTIQADAGSQWNDYRYSLDLAFMRGMFDAAQASGPREVWVAQRRENYGNDWYGLWSKPDAPLPEIPEGVIFNYDPNRDFAALAHAQSPQAVAIVPLWGGENAASLAQSLKNLKPGWDGIVLDGGVDGIERIAKEAAEEKSAAK